MDKHKRADIVKRLKEANKSEYDYYKCREKGYSIEEALELAKEKNSRYIKVEVNGVLYPLKEAMKIVNCEVDYTTVLRRIKLGMTQYQAITRPGLKKY